MGRKPTSDEEMFRWHRAAVAGLRPPIHMNDVHCGWFKTRLVRGGPWVGARIFLERTICPDTGELLSDEILCCDIDGKPCDPLDKWTWIAGHPISQQEYDYLVNLKRFAQSHDPREALATPAKATDLMKVPPPKFSGALRRK